MKWNETDGIDLDWFAIDMDGHLGHFTSGGSRLLPSGIDEQKSRLAGINAALLAMATMTRATVSVRAAGNLDDWVLMATRGLYSYDFVSNARSRLVNGHYRLIARPETPLSLQSPPQGLPDLSPAFHAPNICFGKNKLISDRMLTTFSKT